MASSPFDLDLLLRQTFIARVEYHATLDSTNDRAREYAKEGVGALPLLIVADEQTAGRGRGANRWWTGRNSLAASLLLDADELGLTASRTPLAGLATAVAIVEAVRPRLPFRTVGIHWPNDVFVDAGPVRPRRRPPAESPRPRGIRPVAPSSARKKLAGVLVEKVSNRWLVVGIGLNVNNSLREAPQKLRTTATTLLELTGNEHDRTRILADMLGRLAQWLRQLARAPDRVAAKADALCLQHGQPLLIQVGRRRVRGRCAGIAPDGALVLDTAEGQQKFHSGVLVPGEG
jgi:BirA family biotin operon repressor/biotin-[acetyl-CoA-carboxylase] ligase